MKKLFDGKKTEQVFLLSEYGKQKLLGYADSFKEIAKALEEEFKWEQGEQSRQSRIYNRKLWENRCMLAENLNEMAGVMAQVAGEVFSYKPFPERHARQIVQALRTESILVSDLYYIDRSDGRTMISITMLTEKKGGISVENASDMLSVLMDMRLVPSMNCYYYIDASLRSYTFIEEAGFVVLTGAAKAVKETEPKSGDNYAILESEKGKMTMLLSDGMGSGEKASQDSEVVLDLMEKLIEAGYRPGAAANLVNSALITGGEEQNMSTLDICEVDLYDGVCEFTKIGAAASFIKRGHMVEQISGGSLPLGIFKGIESDCIRRRLMDGDYVFLMSDGIIDAIEDCDYNEDICEIHGNLEQENPKELAEALLQIVLRKTKGHIRDDMTILVFGLWENI
ncbi:MAG: SpoIIE family protein phosphatase [Lachnospiraceae bacterium]|nr:SpoIIE family protein phosphatase [Lachnospiraceae bacterium]